MTKQTKDGFWASGILLGILGLIVPNPYYMLSAFVAFVLMIIGRPRRYFIYFILVGALMNGSAVFSNGRKMPVLQPHIPIPASDKVHVTLTENHRLFYLTDLMGSPDVRFSLGDLFVFFAIPVAFVGLIGEKIRERK